MKIIFFIFFTKLMIINTLLCFVDLERFEDSSIILETKQIYFPEYPNAFNPSIAYWKDSLFMCFREVKFSENYLESKIGICQLDKDFNPIGKPQIIFNGIEHFALQDARIISVEDRLYLIYSAGCKDLIPISNQHSGVNCRMYVAELIFNEDNFIVINNSCLSKFQNANPLRAEKNWVPFDYSGNLLLAYSLLPHRILFPHLSEGKCTTIYETRGDIHWPWGELRGGSQAILEKDCYVSFFHSISELRTIHSKGKKIPHYFIGAYTFTKEPPFEITAISPRPIIGKGFYSGKTYTPYWHPLQVVFVYGVISDQHHYWISYGRQDHEMWIAKLDKEKLLNSLRHVTTEE